MGQPSPRVPSLQPEERNQVVGKAKRNRRERDREALKEKRLLRVMEWAKRQIQENRESQPTLLYEEMTRDELRKLAAERDIPGRGSMNKAQLVEALSSAHGKSS